MKQYIALKAVKFDRKYQKGEKVPENVIAKDMINKLLRCGVLVAGEETEDILEENTEEHEQETEQEQHFTEQQLLQYKKEELEQMAQDMGIEVKQNMTKADIVTLLLQKE